MRFTRKKGETEAEGIYCAEADVSACTSLRYGGGMAVVVTIPLQSPSKVFRLKQDEPVEKKRRNECYQNSGRKP